MLGIVGLVLYSNIRSYSARSLNSWVSGRHCVGVVSILGLSVFILGLVVDHRCDTNVDPVGPDYEERIALFLIFLN